MERLINREYVIDGYSIVDFNDVPNAEWKLRYISDTLSLKLDEEMLNYFYLSKPESDVLETKIRHKGCPVRRLYCLFGMKEKEIVVSVSLSEVINHPSGFGEKDFEYHRRINHDFMDEYDDIYGLRLLIVSIVHMVLRSGLANRLYTYAMSNSLYSGSNVFLKLNTSFECLRFSDWSDRGNRLSYISFVEDVSVGSYTYSLIVFDREEYMKMDHVASFQSLTGDREKALQIFNTLEEACRDISIQNELYI